MSIGRVSTTQYFKLNTERMGKQQGDLLKIQSQLATGQRVLKPSDDPLAMSVALGAKAGVKTLDSYQNNITYLNNQLGQMDIALQSASDVMVSIKQSMLSAGNAALSTADRNILAQELEGQLQELRGIANRKDVNGDYLFSGTQQNVEPFQRPGDAITGSFLESGSAAAAQAVAGRQIQVSNGRFIDLSITGNDAFVDPASNETAFTVLQDAITLLRNPGFPNAQQGATPSDTYLKAFNDRMSQMDGLFDQVQLSRTKVGVRLRETETLSQINQAAQFELERVAGESVGLDYAKAISELSQGQLQLQASQQSFASVSKLSLFNFIG
jgi:flagellar hook-associated protein 3 FlgL